jgi:1-acyl-sn-glycerol-3-phosphate acyltransferase
VIVASNHIGTFDPIVLVAALHKRRLAPRLLATAGLFRAPVLGAVLRACGHIPVNRRTAAAAEALHEAEAALAAAAVVAMYPEGRIGLDPGMWPERGKTGLARLAQRTGATVVPVAQWGAHEVMAYSGRAAMASAMLRALVRRPALRVHFGPPVDLSDLSATTPGAALQATERVMTAVADALMTLRGAEPRLPRYVDPTRPLSTARVRRRPVHGDAAAHTPAQAATVDAAAVEAATPGRTGARHRAEDRGADEHLAATERMPATDGAEVVDGAATDHRGVNGSAVAPAFPATYP